MDQSTIEVTSEAATFSPETYRRELAEYHRQQRAIILAAHSAGKPAYRWRVVGPTAVSPGTDTEMVETVTRRSNDVTRGTLQQPPTRRTTSDGSTSSHIPGLTPPSTQSSVTAVEVLTPMEDVTHESASQTVTMTESGDAKTTNARRAHNKRWSSQLLNIIGL